MKKILLIMHSEAMIERISDLLKEQGYEIHLCTDAIRAVESTKSIEPDLILCESDLPVLSGMQLSRLFKGHSKLARIPFLLLTSNLPSVWEMSRSGFRIEVDDIIQLPISTRIFAETITKWMNPDYKPPSIADRLAGPLTTTSKTKQAKQWNKGRITCVSLGQLMVHLIRYRESGTLHVQTDASRLSAVIDKGSVVEVTSSYIPEDALGAYLIKEMKITKDQFDKSFDIAQTGQFLLGNVLVEMRYLEKHELDYHLMQHKMQKLLGLFEEKWRHAAFEFVPERISPRGEPDIESAPLNKLLFRAVFTKADGKDLQNAFTRNNKDDQPLKLTDNFSRTAKLFNLEYDIVEKLRSMDAKSVNQLKADFPEQYDAYLRRAFFLLITKSAQFRSERPAPEEEKRPAIKPEEERLVAEASENRYKSWEVSGYIKALSEARALIGQGNFPDAKIWLTKALDMNPDSSHAMGMLAWVIYNLAESKDKIAQSESKNMLKKALSLDDTNDTAMVYLGKILRAEGKDGLADSYFRKANLANPANEEAKREVELMRIKSRKKMRYQLE